MPQCLRCQRHGLKCGGPRISTIFVYRNSEKYNEETNRAALNRGLRQHSRDESSDLDEHVRPADAILLPYVSNAMPSFLGIDKSLGWASHRTFYHSILDEFLPKPGTGVFSGDRVHTEPRLYSGIAMCIRALLSMLNSPIRVLDTAVLALLSSYHGWRRNNKHLIEYAKSCYTIALNNFRKELEITQNKAFTSEILLKRQQATLLSSIALQLFEDVSNVDYLSPAYLVHTDGCISILQLLGPNAFDRLNLQIALYGLRSMLVYVALDRRRKTLFAAPEWLYIPDLSYRKTSRDHLFDIAVQLPGLLEKIDAYAAAWPACSSCPAEAQEDNADLAQARLLLYDCAVLQACFDDWLSVLQASHTGSLYWANQEDSDWDPEEAYLLVDPECVPLFSGDFFHLRFASGQKASLLMHYWAFSLELLMGMREVHRLIASAQNGFARTEKPFLAAQVENRNNVNSETVLLEAQIKERAKLILQATAYVTTCFEGVTVSRGPLSVVTRNLQKLGLGVDDDSDAVSAFNAHERHMPYKLHSDMLSDLHSSNSQQHQVEHFTAKVRQSEVTAADIRVGECNNHVEARFLEYMDNTNL